MSYKQSRLPFRFRFRKNKNKSLSMYTKLSCIYFVLYNLSKCFKPTITHIGVCILHLYFSRQDVVVQPCVMFCFLYD